MTAKYMIDTAVGEYLTYWNAVIGPQYDAEHAVLAFDLVPGPLRGFEEWVGEAQVEACRQGFDADELVDVGWCAHRAAQDLKDAADAIANAAVTEEPADHACTNCGAEPDAGCNCHMGRFTP